MFNICDSCITCLKRSEPDHPLHLYKLNPHKSERLYADLKHILHYCIPEMKMVIPCDANICTSCINELCVAYNFKKMCLESEQKLLTILLIAHSSDSTDNSSKPAMQNTTDEITEKEDCNVAKIVIKKEVEDQDEICIEELDLGYEGTSDYDNSEVYTEIFRDDIIHLEENSNRESERESYASDNDQVVLSDDNDIPNLHLANSPLEISENGFASSNENFEDLSMPVLEKQCEVIHPVRKFKPATGEGIYKSDSVSNIDSQNLLIPVREMPYDLTFPEELRPRSPEKILNSLPAESMDSLVTHSPVSKIQDESHEFIMQCKHCSSRFKNNSTLAMHIKSTHIRHIKSTNTKLYICRICKLAFTTLKGLRVHANRKLHHSLTPVDDDIKFTKICNPENTKTFNNYVPSETIDSLDERFNNYVPSESIDSLDEHSPVYEIQDRLNLYNKKCKHCFKRFRNNTTLAVHIKSTHSNAYACRICKFTSKTSTGLKVHLNRKSHHFLTSDGEVPSESKFTKTFKQESTEALNNSVPPENTDLLDVRSPVCEIQDRSNELSIKCKHCSKRFKYKANLAVHIKSRHRKTYTCHICKFPCKTLKGLKLHINRKSHHPSAPIGEVSCIVKSTKKCTSKSSENLNNSIIATNNVESLKALSSVNKMQYRSNENISKTNEKFECEQCFLIFEDKLSLKEHIKEMHGKIFTCNICSFISSTLPGLGTHKKIHRGNSDLLEGKKCPICNFEVYSEMSLQVHMRNVHKKISKRGNVHKKINRRGSPCPICNRVYSKVKLITHMHKHSSDESKYISCNVCKMPFIEQSDLDKHLKVNHPIECSVCSKHFSLKKQLHKHFFKCHQTMLEHNYCMTTFNSPRLFKCELCKKQCISQDQLNLHRCTQVGSTLTVPLDNFERFHSLCQPSLSETDILNGTYIQSNGNESHSKTVPEIIEVACIRYRKHFNVNLTPESFECFVKLERVLENSHKEIQIAEPKIKLIDTNILKKSPKPRIQSIRRKSSKQSPVLEIQSGKSRKRNYKIKNFVEHSYCCRGPEETVQSTRSLCKIPPYIPENLYVKKEGKNAQNESEKITQPRYKPFYTKNNFINASLSAIENLFKKLSVSDHIDKESPMLTKEASKISEHDSELSALQYSVNSKQTLLCYYCPRVFEVGLDLTSHLTQAHEDKLLCHLYATTLSDETNLSSHFNSQHTNTEQKLCHEQQSNFVNMDTSTLTEQGNISYLKDNQKQTVKENELFELDKESTDNEQEVYQNQQSSVTNDVNKRKLSERKQISHSLHYSHREIIRQKNPLLGSSKIFQYRNNAQELCQNQQANIPNVIAENIRCEQNKIISHNLNDDQQFIVKEKSVLLESDKKCQQTDNEQQLCHNEPATNDANKSAPVEQCGINYFLNDNHEQIIRDENKLLEADEASQSTNSEKEVFQNQQTNVINNVNEQNQRSHSLYDNHGEIMKQKKSLLGSEERCQNRNNEQEGCQPTNIMYSTNESAPNGQNSINHTLNGDQQCIVKEESILISLLVSGKESESNNEQHPRDNESTTKDKNESEPAGQYSVSRISSDAHGQIKAREENSLHESDEKCKLTNKEQELHHIQQTHITRAPIGQFGINQNENDNKQHIMEENNCSLLECSEKYVPSEGDSGSVNSESCFSLLQNEDYIADKTYFWENGSAPNEYDFTNNVDSEKHASIKELIKPEELQELNEIVPEDSTIENAVNQIIDFLDDDITEKNALTKDLSKANSVTDTKKIIILDNILLKSAEKPKQLVLKELDAKSCANSNFVKNIVPLYSKSDAELKASVKDVVTSKTENQSEANSVYDFSDNSLLDSPKISKGKNLKSFRNFKNCKANKSHLNHLKEQPASAIRKRKPYGLRSNALTKSDCTAAEENIPLKKLKIKLLNEQKEGELCSNEILSKNQSHDIGKVLPSKQRSKKTKVSKRHLNNKSSTSKKEGELCSNEILSKNQSRDIGKVLPSKERSKKTKVSKRHLNNKSSTSKKEGELCSNEILSKNQSRDIEKVIPSKERSKKIKVSKRHLSNKSSTSKEQLSYCKYALNRKNLRSFCNVCNRTFNSKSQYNKHKVKCKPESIEEPKNLDEVLSTIDKIVEKIQKIKKYKCKYCDMAFVTKAQIRVHVKLTHPLKW